MLPHCLFWLCAGWDINRDLWAWKAITWVEFSNPITSRGYGFYTAILYILASALALSIGLCVWVG